MGLFSAPCISNISFYQCLNESRVMKINAIIIVISMVLFSVVLTTDTLIAGKEGEMEQIRKSVISGSWYPGDAHILKKTIASYIESVPNPQFDGKLVALISPHAGYQYSGPVAAYAYKLLEKHKYDTVVVIAPSHHARFPNVSVYDKGGYQTPFGVMPLNQKIVDALKQKDDFVHHVPEAHYREHSLEIQLPFIQYMMPDAKLVPLVMGNQSFQTCQRLANLLAEVVEGESVLIVASSDLSHFHTDHKARELDQVVMDNVRDFNPDGLSHALEKGKCEACGGGPMVAAMLAARKLGADKSQVLHYANSGDVTGEKSQVVGYMAAALWNTQNNNKKKINEGEKKETSDVGLTAEDKALLHQIARTAIVSHFDGRPVPKPEAASPALDEPRGAFVTLNIHGRLRGCIGHIIGSLPLAETVSRMAVAAAFEDPRFPPLTREELDRIEIEISVLSPLKKIEDMNDIEVGKHGIYLKNGWRSGLLLPQVAGEYGWDRKTFLEQTCRKAGLPTNAWKNKDIEVYIFSAEVF